MRIEIDDDVPVVEMIEALACYGLVLRRVNGKLRLQKAENYDELQAGARLMALLLVEPANDQAV